jgi:hypothetical protein
VQRIETPKLYSSGQVVLAALLGSVLAGAFLIYRNHKALHKHTAARCSLVLGVMAIALMMIAAYFLPETTRENILLIGSLIGVHQWYRQDQATLFRNHLASGGERQSWLLATGIGLLFFIVIVCILLGIDILYIQD